MNLPRVLHCIWNTPGLNGRMGQPVLIHGRPGTAKTSRVGQAARNAGLPLVTIISSIREPADMLGLPSLEEDPEFGRVADYAPPKWARRMAKAGRGVVFFDELTTCPPAVQAANLRVIQEGVVGDLEMPPGIRFVAAANAVEDMNGGYDLSPPLANRFIHLVDQDVSAEDWAAWMTAGAVHDGGSGKGQDPEAVEKRVRKEWAEAFAKSTGLSIAFLRRHDMILKLPASKDPKASKAWPSPRSWEMAVRAMAGAEIHGLSSEDTDALLAGCVGEAAATAFVAFRRDVDLPDPAALLDGKVKWQPDDRLDRTEAVLHACTALICPADAQKRMERATAFCHLLKDKVVKGHGDLAYTAFNRLVNNDLRGGTIGKVAQELLGELMPTVKAAGAFG